MTTEHTASGAVHLTVGSLSDSVPRLKNLRTEVYKDKNRHDSNRQRELRTWLTVRSLSDVTMAPFMWFTASPLSKACLRAHSGNTHSSAPYQSGGRLRLLNVTPGSTPWFGRVKQRVSGA